MKQYPEIETLKTLLAGAEHVVILQADNPDADSLGSSLALEQLLGDAGKKVWLYCATDIPTYLRYLSGWDRVMNELPSQFDMSIIVDVSTYSLFEKLQASGQMGWVKARAAVVLDHHKNVQNNIDFAQINILDDTVSSTSELVYHIAQQMDWKLTSDGGANVMTGILGDTQGLSNNLASATTYRVMAELVELGVDRPRLEELRREYSKMLPEVFRYKAKLIEHTEFVDSGRIAHVTVPQEEISTYSPLYNPVPLILNDMLSTSDVALAIVFKQYDSGITTGAIRANFGYAVADKLAEHLGGGGHPFASGFKIVNGRPFSEVKSECLEFAATLLNNLSKEYSDETLQHTDAQS